MVRFKGEEVCHYYIWWSNVRYDRSKLTIAVSKFQGSHITSAIDAA